MSATSGSTLFPSDDGLAKIAELFVMNAGKELSGDALRLVLFLEQNGSRDLAVAVMQKKSFQASASDMHKMVEKLSPAQHAKDMLAAQTEARAASMKGL